MQSVGALTSKPKSGIPVVLNVKPKFSAQLTLTTYRFFFPDDFPKCTHFWLQFKMNITGSSTKDKGILQDPSQKDWGQRKVETDQ